MDSKIEQGLRDYFHSKHVRKAMLFGSHARGTDSRKSDYDIIIIHEASERFFYRHRDFEDLYPLLDNRVDMLIYTPGE